MYVHPLPHYIRKRKKTQTLNRHIRFSVPAPNLNSKGIPTLYTQYEAIDNGFLLYI